MSVERALYTMIKRTGAASLLSRRSYARRDVLSVATEHVIAALGSAYLAADLSIALNMHFDRWHSLAPHLQVLRHTPEAIFSIAAQAERAAKSLRQNYGRR